MRLDGGIGLNTYPHGPLGTGGTQLKVKPRKRFRKVEEDDDDMFKYDYGCACEDRIRIVGERPL